MTAVVALWLIAGVLVAILYPLYVRRSSALGASGSTLLELDERYRAALADLQDTEMDWQVGNLTEADYHVLRDRYRLRAAATLREIDARQSLENAVRAEIQRVRARQSEPGPEGTAADGAAVLPRDAARRFALVGGIAALVAVGAIALLYARLVGTQAAQAPRAMLPIAHAHAVTIDPNGEFWVSHHDGLLRSTDGAAWRAQPMSGDVMALVGDGNHRLALGHDVLSETNDGGASWHALATDLPGTDVHGAQQGSRGTYAYVVDYGLFSSADGSHWERLSDPLPQEVGALAVLQRDPNADIVYLAVGGSVLRTGDGGRTWSSAAGAANLALSGFVNSIAVDPVQGALYAGSTEGLFRSLAGGSDWARLPFRGSVVAVGARGDRIAVVDDRGQFFLSTDGGGSWTAGQ